MLTPKSLNYRMRSMGNENGPAIIDFDQVLRDIQDENLRSLQVILDEQISTTAVEIGIPEKRISMPRIFDLFIPPGSR